MQWELATIKLYIILIVSLGLFACSASNGDKDRHNESTMLTQTSAFEQAVQAEQKGDSDKALYYYIQALQFDPKNGDLLYRIARIHDQRGNNPLAIKIYTQAVEHDPTMIAAYQGLGVVQMESKQYKQAKENLQKVISLDQARLKAQGATNREAGYFALDNKSPVKSYNVLGVIEDMHSNFDLARIYYNLSLASNDSSANLLSNIGYSYYLTGQLTRAESYFKKAVNADPKFKRAWANLGLIYVRKGQYNRAIKTFKQIMTEFGAYNDLGYFVMLDGRLDEAAFFFQKAIDMSPSYFAKAYSNLELVQLKKRELWLLKKEAVPK